MGNNAATTEKSYELNLIINMAATSVCWPAGPALLLKGTIKLSLSVWQVYCGWVERCGFMGGGRASARKFFCLIHTNSTSAFTSSPAPSLCLTHSGSNQSTTPTIPRGFKMRNNTVDVAVTPYHPLFPSVTWMVLVGQGQDIHSLKGGTFIKWV